MVPDNEPVSAFAVYNMGTNGTTRRQRRRKMRKLKKKASPQADESQNVAGKSIKKVGKINGKPKKTPKKGKNQSADPEVEKIAESSNSQSEELSVDVSEKTSKKGKNKKTKLSDKSNVAAEKSVPNKGKNSNSTKKARSFNSINDSLNLASTSGFRLMPSSTPAKPISESSGDEMCVMDAVDSFKSELESSKVTNKRKKRQAIRIDKVKKRALDVQGSDVFGKEAFERLLAPVTIDTFMKDYWEKSVLYIPATHSKKFDDLLSTELMDKILRNENLCFGRDLDVTTYSDGERQNHNIEGARAHAHVVWDYYANGCSIRLLHPHTHSRPLLVTMSALQEHFGCLVGGNSYLTPPSSQGFAPHYDDIEAFIIQLEGRKRWRVYKPRSKHEMLPRFSSPNFSDADLTEPPTFDSILSPGDILYFPRGFIHQAHTLHNEHSLHVTISVYQKTAWCDLMEKVVSNALKSACANDVEFRKGLPIGYLRQAGAFTKYSAADRRGLIHGAKQLMSKLINHVDIDSAVDALGVQFMHDALPPVLTAAEGACSVIGNGWKMGPAGKLSNKIEFPPTTRVRLTRANCFRLVQEDVKSPEGDTYSQVSLYYTVDNSTLFHGEEPNFLVVEPDLLVTLRALVNAYPHFTAISDLPYEADEKIYGLICDLWDHGLLVTETPPEPVDDKSSTVLSEISRVYSSESDTDSDSSDDETGKLDDMSLNIVTDNIISDQNVNLVLNEEEIVEDVDIETSDTSSSDYSTGSFDDDD